MAVYTDFTATPDTFDSREAIERIEELTAEFIDATETDPAEFMSADDWALGLDKDDARELFELLRFASDAEDVSDWQYGETFIRDDYFESYAEEFCTDIGAIPADLPGWIVIDWEETASNLRQDYTDFQFRGVTYWARS